MKDENKNKNQNTEEQQQEQTPKKESFLKRTVKRFGRDLLKIGGGIAIGAVVTAAVFRARSGNEAEDTVSDEDQETEDEEDVSEEDSEE